MAMEVDIAIVGGGLGGLALALGLQERGLRGHVFEKAPKVRTHHGTTISLGPNGVEARFEVAEERRRRPSPAHTKVVRAKMVVGVDGMRSQVRKAMVGDEPRGLLHTRNALIRTENVSSLNLHGKGEWRFCRYRYAKCDKSGFLLDAGRGLTLRQVRVLDASGEVKEAYAQDLEAHGRDVRKVRDLRQTAGLEFIENFREAIESTDADAVREARVYDRVPLTSWSDSSKRIVLSGDAAHGMYSGPGQGARTAFEDAHQLSLLLHDAFASPAPEETIPAAVKKFEEVRIPRVTKIQAWAAESTSLPPEIPQWVRRLSPEQQQIRSLEFSTWVQLYPEAEALAYDLCRPTSKTFTICSI